MADVTAQFAGPFPEDADPAEIDDDIKAVAEWVERLLLGKGADAGLAGVTPGDFKVSARSAHHGRWYMCPLGGDEFKTQAQIEAALGLDAGEAQELCDNVLGTGAPSIYGDAPVGQVCIPRGDRMLHPVAAGHGRKGAGSVGGVESVTLTAAQSGLRRHDHGTVLPNHTHNYTVTDHTHSISHTHTYSGNTWPASFYFAAGEPGLNTANNNNHYHYYEGTTSGPSNGSSGGMSTGAGTFASGNPNSTPTVTSSVPTNVQAATGQDATDSHDNMPPYRVMGNVFIRV